MKNQKLSYYLLRTSMVLLFIITGVQKIINPSRLSPLLQEVGLPIEFALAIGCFEILVGVAFIVVFQIRWIALVLAAWCVFTGFVGHRFWVDPAQLSSFLKNVGLAGAFLLFARPEVSGRQLR